MMLALVAACSPDLLLGPDAAQGIDGLVLLGPQCPVQQAGGSCPDLPHQAWLEVRSAGGERVTRISSGRDGRFRVGLASGSYRLVGESGDPFPRGGEEVVTVVTGEWVSVTIHFDTGIR
jgi:hypothetical protein